MGKKKPTDRYIYFGCVSASCGYDQQRKEKKIIKFGEEDGKNTLFRFFMGKNEENKQTWKYYISM